MTGGNRGENQGQEDDAGDGDDEHIPAMGAQDGSGRRTDKAGAYVIEEPVEAGRAAFGPVCPDGDEAARHGIGSRKSEADRFPSGFGMVHSQVLHAVHGLSMLPKEVSFLNVLPIKKRARIPATPFSDTNSLFRLFVLMTILAQAFFTLVRSHLMSFTFLSAWHVI